MRGACAGSVCGSQRAAGPAAQCRPPSSRSPCSVQCSAEAPPSCSRRQAAAAAASLLAAAAWPAARPAAAAAAEAVEPSSLSNAEFYNVYPYVRPSDILPYLRDAARPGDADSVLAAIDAFAERYPMYRCGPEKGAILERLVARQRPALALELGTFMGYGTLRIARNLPPGGRVVTVEAGEEQADVARQILEFAGVRGVGAGPDARVQVLPGLSSDLLPRLRELAGLPPGSADGPPPLAFVFLDHCKPCYLPDLLSLERLGLVGAGSLVLADNVLVPGAPTYLAHVGAPAALPRGAGSLGSGASPVDADAVAAALASAAPNGIGAAQAAEAVEAAEGGYAYRSALLPTAFEVEERYKTDFQGPRQDAMALSLCVAAA